MTEHVMNSPEGRRWMPAFFKRISDSQWADPGRSGVSSYPWRAERQTH
jgi:hypothetical protein